MRPLDDDEVHELLSAAVVAHLATVDSGGYPHVTPIWFVWADDRCYLTSYAGRPHLRRIRGDPRVGLVIDVEAPLRADGQRPNKQIRIVGDATVRDDIDGEWTAAIRRKYVGARTEAQTASSARSLITIVPTRRWAVASV